jgi:NAD+ kinase
MAELRVDVDGQFMYNQRSDGLIISTPPAPPPTRCRPAARCCIRPGRHRAGADCAARAVNRPIVLPESSEIVVEIVRGRDISVNFDMQTFASLRRRTDRDPALAAHDHLPASGRLELLPHPA